MGKLRNHKAGTQQDSVGSASACFPLPVLSSSFEAVPVDLAGAFWSPQWILPQQLRPRERCLGSSCVQQRCDASYLEQIPQYGPEAGVTVRRQMSSALGSLQGSGESPVHPVLLAIWGVRKGSKGDRRPQERCPCRQTSHLLPSITARQCDTSE